ncbi:anti-sigma regulatory factor [Phormidium tenue FACHB-886]|nr:anti-sigma regulatory factor [Phormidium tenue FACHB-886]
MQKRIFQTKTDLAELSSILAWFEEFAQPLLTELLLMQCQTLLAEGFTNAVRHAHKGQVTETPIEIEVALSNTDITMRIWDSGAPFDLSAKMRSLPAQIDTDAVGGRGLKLLEKIADRVSYERVEDDRNCLVIIKKLTREHSPPLNAERKFLQ